MAGKTATAPDGRVWHVRRQWLARTPRWRGHDADDGADAVGGAAELADGCASDIEVLAVISLVVVGLLLAWFFVLPALIFLADLLFLFVTAAIGVAIRVLFRRPWDVVAETSERPAERVVTPVVGFRASGAKIDEIAYRIEATGTPLAR